MEPSAGTFVVGSTFNVPIYLNSEGEAVNAIAISAKFPPDKLQLVSPSTGQSVITLWTEQPSYDNRTGHVMLQGVIPSGLVTGKGLVTTMTFRVKSSGMAYLKFLDDTKVLKHDGLGTDVLKATTGAAYALVLPPPAGPVVASETHPDQNAIYRTRSVFLSWAPEDPSVAKYSYVLNDLPVDIPDDIAEGEKTSVVYRDLQDGKHYFHIKSYRLGAWGGTTHFAVAIDAAPPAEFPVTLLPDDTIRHGEQVVVQFATTDAFSGVDHYEIKVIPLNPHATTDAPQVLFVEAVSPYVLPSPIVAGEYDIIVRAYDKAGNFRESTATLRVRAPFFGRIGDAGIDLGPMLLPWWLLLAALLLLVIALVSLAVRARRRHREKELLLEARIVPADVAATRSALEEKQKRYVQITQLVIAALFVVSGWAHAPALRAETVSLDPPVVTTLSRNIGNDEIFYVGGTMGVPGARVVIHLQNAATGETLSEETLVDERGEWFYRHDRFLSAGEYILWAQAAVGGEQSPPSPQMRLSVARQALSVGATRISYEFLFAAIAALLLFAVIGLLCYIFYHDRAAKKKHARWLLEVREAEEAVRTGFAVLKRDIEAELALVRKAKLTRSLAKEEVGREEQLLRDLAWVEEHIMKEVGDVEWAERS